MSFNDWNLLASLHKPLKRDTRGNGRKTIVFGSRDYSWAIYAIYEVLSETHIASIDSASIGEDYKSTPRNRTT